jgi:TonB family protein
MRFGWIAVFVIALAGPAAAADALPSCVASGITLPTRITPLDLGEEYPDLSIYQGEAGDVVVKFTIHEDGSVSDASISSSSDFVRLDAASLDAVAGLHYQPAVSDGKPVACVNTMRVEWILPKTPRS